MFIHDTTAIQMGLKRDPAENGGDYVRKRQE